MTPRRSSRCFSLLPNNADYFAPLTVTPSAAHVVPMLGRSVTLEGWDGSAGVLGLARYPSTDCLYGDAPTVQSITDRSGDR